MNKTAIKNFSINARQKLLDSIRLRANLLGISDKGIAQPLAQSTPDLQFFDISTGEYAQVSGKEKIQRRNALAAVIRDEAEKQGYAKAFGYVTEEVAYTWFNRLIAIRFMEVNDYLPDHVRVLSSENSDKLEPDMVTRPFEAGLSFTQEERNWVLRLKDENKLDELFQILFIKQCNKLNEILPELFETTNDYTESLLTISFADKDGVVYHLIHDIPESDFDISHTDENGRTPGQVEIIGWMYQYYNTELNDLVYDGSMSKSRIPKELLPAATTIYTPDWAVKYMVENSLGHLWLEGHPNDALKANWKYYLEEAKQEPSVQEQLAKIHAGYAKLNPEDIRVIDPCMGSGHILVYAFDVLMQIYETQGYSRRDAACLIVEKNLYGLDINPRAYQLAYFAVMMKARQYNRRILNGKIKPNLYVIHGSAAMKRSVLDFIANSNPKIQADLQSIADNLADAEEYGSILNISPVDFEALYTRFEEIRNTSYSNLFDASNQQLALKTVLPLVEQAQVMGQKYNVVVTNPPYLGSSRFSTKLNDYVVANYPDVKADLSMVMYKHALQDMCKNHGFVSFITTTSWMFLSSFEKLRNLVLACFDIESLVDFGTELYDGKVGHNPIVAWVNRKSHTEYTMTGIRLVDYCYARRDEKELEFFDEKNYFYSEQSNFSKIPGSPVAYWVSKPLIHSFNEKKIDTYGSTNNGFTTGDNEQFLRFWQEVPYNDICFDAISHDYARESHKRWFPYNKGGAFRKWYGNNEYVLNWFNDGADVKAYGHLVPRSLKYQFMKSVSWSKISSSVASFKVKDTGTMFDVAGLSLFPEDNKNFYYLLALCNSCYSQKCLGFLSPTLNYEAGHIASIPVIIDISQHSVVESLAINCVQISKADWDSYETSWDFKRHPLL